MTVIPAVSVVAGRGRRRSFGEDRTFAALFAVLSVSVRLHGGAK